ncbi:MAG: PCMD domain-containing protein [Prevotella sp.]|nr:PCMD domain-containing protein [Prevotella sp.]MDY5667451.1 PCMD domain-containing protein [Alloprevotella sp.]
MNFKSFTLSALLLIMGATSMKAIPYSPEYLEANQAEEEMSGMRFIPKGNFESWTSQSIKESGIIGGNTVDLLHIGSPWGSSNVWAKVSGVTKTNVSVYRDTHPGHGHCAKLYTHIVEAKVLGIINIKVLAAGSIFLGNTIQPITDTKNPMAKLNAGLRFTKRPKALVFDYKTHIVKGNRIRQNGITKGSKVAGQDMADCILYLQKRWEDARGNIYAKRVGTMVHRFSSSTNWRNNQSFAIQYGDIRGKSFYSSAWALTSGATTKYARNSKGRMVPVKEVGWANANETPTHIVLQFDSSHGGAYVGTVGNTLWVDNVRLAY